MIKTYDPNYRGDCPLEDTDLMNLVAWFDYNYPNICRLMFHVANESDMPVQGRVIAKKKGVRSGIPDLMFLQKRGKYSGLLIEMKRKAKKGKPKATPVSPNQKFYLKAFSEQGYFCAVCYGLEEAKKCIKEYLQIK